MLRYALPAFALLSLFLFPWPLGVAAIFLSAGFAPASGILLGVSADLIHFAPGAYAFPYASALGACATLAGFVVQRFVKARIMGG
jgi:hypothetical protein